MCSSDRNRRNNRSIAFSVVTALVVAVLLFATPVVANTAEYVVNENGTVLNANTAEYVVNENGTVLNANISMIRQNEFWLVKLGFFGSDEALEVKNLTFKDESGNNATYEKSGYKLLFEKGNYTLSYEAPLSGHFIYAKYPNTYNASVFIPKPYTTGHLVLGTASTGGKINETPKGTEVVYDNAKYISITFYESNRPFVLYVFLGVWGAVMLLLLIRHKRIKKRVGKIRD